MARSSRNILALGRLLLLGLAATLFQSSNAQEIGVDICACSPTSYEFTLDFSLTCPPVNITRGDAIAATTCLVSPFGDPEVTDLIPISVQNIDILELNQNLQIIVQENIAGSYGDQDTFVYQSIANFPDMIKGPEDIPRAIQLNIIGVNKFDEPIINVYLITFTNDCGQFPVFLEGESAGWTIFSAFEPPREEFCPTGLTFPPSSSPTSPPTSPPTLSPTVGDSPTNPPTPSPTKLPTTMPPSMVMSMDYEMSEDIMEVIIDSMDDMEGEFGRGPKTKGSKKQKKQKGNDCTGYSDDEGCIGGKKGSKAKQSSSSKSSKTKLGKGGKGSAKGSTKGSTKGGKGSTKGSSKSGKGGKKGNGDSNGSDDGSYDAEQDDYASGDQVTHHKKGSKAKKTKLAGEMKEHYKSSTSSQKGAVMCNGNSDDEGCTSMAGEDSDESDVDSTDEVSDGSYVDSMDDEDSQSHMTGGKKGKKNKNKRIRQ